MVRLTIYKRGTASDVRCEVNKYEFHDKAMGEQYVMFTIASPVPIPFEVGDWCEFRGQTYTLNVEPTCTQKARIATHGAAFTYESVKFSSPQDDMTRCMILDIVPTSGEHQAAYGTNYTGSANFTLNCFETVFVYQGDTIYYAPVHALLDRIKANLDRLYPGDPQNPDTCWQYYIDDDKCRTDDKILTFSNWTVAQALAEVHNTFKLDYVVRGRKIIVGDISTKYPELAGLIGYVTDLDAHDNPLFFGYRKGYLSETNQGKSLFQIKKVSKNDQQIVTRLRAVGSTKNMPYRYYHNTYGTQEVVGGLGLPQTMFVQNLQLPDTFLPPTAEEGQESKATGNARRDIIYEGSVRHVLGETNDSYIDKNDDAASCPEGIREAVARWDGSDGELPEIYPTIEEATYGELRANNVADIDGTKGSTAYPNYGKDERIDEILDVDRNDCNVGNGVMTESEAFGMTQYTAVVNCETRQVAVGSSTQNFDLFTIGTTQEKGDYILSYTTQWPVAFVTFSPGPYGGQDYRVHADVTITVSIFQVPLDGSARSRITYFTKNGSFTKSFGSYGRTATNGFSLKLPDFHNTEEEWETEYLRVTTASTIEAELLISVSNVTTEGSSVNFNNTRFSIGIKGSDQTQEVRPEAIWQPSSSALYYSSTPFHIMLKDLGMNLPAAAAVDGNDIVISMKSGQCAGREFVVKTSSIVEYVQEGEELVEENTGKKGWLLELDRVNDDSIHAYFPSENNKILPGDQFVLLNIALPDAYIKAAETRLLVAATNHLADNCDTKYTYQPFVDDLYLQRNIDRHANDPENSVFWRLYAGMKFPFYGIPKEATDPLPVADITIETLTIKMGDKITPQVEITLNDKLEQGMIQRLQTTVDRLYGSVFSLGGVTYSSSSAVSDATIYHFGKEHFLSKTDDDTAEGLITFEKGLDVKALANILQGYIGSSIGSSTYESGMLGGGWKIDSSDNSMELDSLTVRKTMKVFELLIQQVKATGGEIIVSPANGRIKNIRLFQHYFTLEIENGVDGNKSFGNMFKENDLVRCQRWDSELQTTRSYWAEVQDSVGDTITLNYDDLDDGSGNIIVPQIGDELVLMGNTVDTNRQSAISISATDNGKPRITVFNNIHEKNLEGCTRLVLGNLNGIEDDTLTPSGYGLYSDNVFLKGEFHLKNGGSEVSIGEELVSIRTDLGSTGIDIEDGEITLTAGKTNFVNDEGNQIASFTGNGLQSNVVECLDEDGNIRVRLDKDGLKMYYPNGQVMKEEVFVYDEHGVSGAATCYYEEDGTLKWMINTEGTLDHGEVNSYWDDPYDSYYLGDSAISDIVTGAAQIKHIGYVWTRTEGSVINCELSQYHTSSAGSPYEGKYTKADISYNPPASTVPMLEGWIMNPLTATQSGSSYVRTFEYYYNGERSTTGIVFHPKPSTTKVLANTSYIKITYNPTTDYVTGYAAYTENGTVIQPTDPTP